jgi:hypothetical protein
MSTLIHKIITTAGMALIAKAQAGNPITFTKFEIGDGTLPENADIKSMTSLIRKVIGFPVSEKKFSSPAEVVISGSFSNALVTTAFYYRELGLYALDPDIGEIMYAYGNAGAAADQIPPAASGSLSEKMVGVTIYVGEDTNVTVQMQSGVYALQTDMAAAETQISKLTPVVVRIDLPAAAWNTTTEIAAINHAGILSADDLIYIEFDGAANDPGGARRAMWNAALVQGTDGQAAGVCRIKANGVIPPGYVPVKITILHVG